MPIEKELKKKKKLKKYKKKWKKHLGLGNHAQSRA
jgi:hypothetical protein